MDALGLLYDYFEDPPRAAALIRERKPYALGLLGALAGGAGAFTARALAGKLLLLSFSGPSLVLVLLWQAAFLFAATAAVHLLLSMSGARGEAGALFVHLGLSELAWLAAAPAALIAQALSPRSPWPARAAFLGIALWSLALKARSLGDEYGVGPGRAWLTLALPALAAALLIGLTAAIGVAVLAFQALS